MHSASLGLARAAASDLKGGDAAHNAEIVTSVLEGKSGPQRDVVVLNAAAGLVAAGLADDVAAAISPAEAAIDNGSARDALESLRSGASSLVAACPSPDRRGPPGPVPRRRPSGGVP